MGQALQVISGRVVNPGATITALTVNTNDSFTVRAFEPGSRAGIIQAWAQEGTAGVYRIRSPLLHDPTQGIRTRVVTAAARPLLPYETFQPLEAQDALTVELSGGAAETDFAAFLVFYENLRGVAARLATWDQLQPHVVNIDSAEAAFTTGATAGQYGGSTALNATFDLWHRSSNYAILGYLVDTAVGLIGFTGIDTGNLRVAGPGSTEAWITADWFVELSKQSGLPTIPVINAANIGGTNIDAAHTTASVAINVSVIVAELDSPPV